MCKMLISFALAIGLWCGPCAQAIEQSVPVFDLGLMPGPGGL
jgi:hypothetical protein